MTFWNRLVRTPRESCRFPMAQAIAHDGLIAFFKQTGLWSYPVKASGDLESMRFLDKTYWLYKSENPVLHAERGSGLEDYFEKAKQHVWSLPAGFIPASEIRLSAAGDLMNHAFLANSEDTLYREVDELLFGVDLAMANLECVVLREAMPPGELDLKAGPPLYFEPRAFEVATGVGDKRYGFVSTACNHSLDFGRDGVETTIEALRTKQIAFHGVNVRDADADMMTLVEINGVRLGIVSFTFGLNAHQPPSDRPRIVNRMPLLSGPEDIDFSQIKTQLAHGQREGVDFVIAQLHWGMEFEFYPRPQQVELAHHLAEMGVDAIIGHHPHVLQPSESYRTRREPHRVVPIFYSLGNLINPWSAEYLCRSGVARIELTKGADANGATRTYVKSAALIEVVQSVDMGRKKVILQRG